MKWLILLVTLFSAQLLYGQHSVRLDWTQGTANAGCTTDCPITSNKIYRGTRLGGPYTLLFSSGSPVTTYTDSTVINGAVYFYVETAVATCNGNVDCGGVVATAESAFSSEAQAQIPADVNKGAKYSKYKKLGVQ
jgi:hypothetical protein